MSVEIEIEQDIPAPCSSETQRRRLKLGVALDWCLRQTDAIAPHFPSPPLLPPPAGVTHGMGDPTRGFGRQWQKWGEWALPYLLLPPLLSNISCHVAHVMGQPARGEIGSGGSGNGEKRPFCRCHLGSDMLSGGGGR